MTNDDAQALLDVTIASCRASVDVLDVCQQRCRAELSALDHDTGQPKPYDAALITHLVWLTGETLRLSAEVRRLARVAAGTSSVAA